MFIFQSSNSSVLEYVPQINDHGKELACQVDNPDLEQSVVTDSLTLEIHCKHYKSAFLPLFRKPQAWKNFKGFSGQNLLLV